MKITFFDIRNYKYFRFRRLIILSVCDKMLQILFWYILAYLAIYLFKINNISFQELTKQGLWSNLYYILDIIDKNFKYFKNI